MGGYVSGNELTVFASSKENQPQPARVLKDSKTGVQVHLQDGETAAIDSLSVRHIETGSSETPAVLGNQDYDLFDITLRDRQGQVVANTKDTLVYLPVDEGKAVLRVIYLPNTTHRRKYLRLRRLLLRLLLGTTFQPLFLKLVISVSTELCIRLR